jgi:hypothetical protein
MKIGRNQLCPCGSGLKFKKCCGALTARPKESVWTLSPELQRFSERQRADETIREQQQGLGRPIVAFKANEHQVVAVGDTVHFSRVWKTFPDFLFDYIKRILDPTWGNSELAKPFVDRHPIIQWYEAFCRYQQGRLKTVGVPAQAVVTGVVACYLGLAYSLYLLAHNVELQERLIRRLKVSGQFQGAYYELIVANMLIRAGFELVLLDESDRTSGHCEFTARSRRTGKKYWVEAKMRAVVGLLGRTALDGTTDPNPLSRFVRQLNDALAKPAADERLIFIDLNADPQPGSVGQPTWIEQAARRLERYERKEMAEGVVAYVFITNFASHRGLNAPAAFAGFFFGLGIPDLNRPGNRRVSDAYRTKLKHIDVHHIGDALQTYYRFPTTFDGGLPSETFQGTSRVMVGNTYCFGDPENGGVVGTVTYASVNEAESAMYVAISDQL